MNNRKKDPTNEKIYRIGNNIKKVRSLNMLYIMGPGKIPSRSSDVRLSVENIWWTYIGIYKVYLIFKINKIGL